MEQKKNNPQERGEGPQPYNEYKIDVKTGEILKKIRTVSIYWSDAENLNSHSKTLGLIYKPASEVIDVPTPERLEELKKRIAELEAMQVNSGKANLVTDKSELVETPLPPVETGDAERRKVLFAKLRERDIPVPKNISTEELEKRVANLKNK